MKDKGQFLLRELPKSDHVQILSIDQHGPYHHGVIHWDALFPYLGEPWYERLKEKGEVNIAVDIREI